MRIFVLFVGIVMICSTARSQQTDWVENGSVFRSWEVDSTEAHFLAQAFIRQKILDGNIYARIDSVITKNSKTTYYFHLGKREKWQIRKLLVTGEDSGSISRSNFKKLIETYTNGGYPFAEFKVLNVHRKNDLVYSDIEIIPNVQIRYDTLSVLGSADVSREFLWTALNLKPGDLFSEQSFNQISDKLNGIPYLRQTREPDVGFSNNLARVYLHLDRVSTSSFEGILGLQQNGEGENQLTGNIQLNLQNLFRSGKTFRMNWSRFDAESQSLDLYYAHPYLMGSDIQFDFNLALVKQDTSFLTREIGMGVETLIFHKVFFGFDFRDVNSNLIQPNPEMDFNEFRTRWYGIRAGKSPVGDRQRRMSSFTFEGKIQIGQRSLNTTDGSDSLPRHSISLKTEGELFAQMTVGQRGAFNTTSVFKLIRNADQIENEFFRVGGLRSFRGFNENEFFVNTLLAEKIEYRQYFEQRSYLMIFTDIGFIRGSGFEGGRPISSLGTGLVLKAGKGLFNFIFANGFFENRPFTINETRIHFGYTSYF